MGLFEPILVTGGMGFIGSHLVEALLKRNYEVKVIDNLSSGSAKNLEKFDGKPNFSFIRGDLLDFDDLRRALEGCRTVFHLAANPEVRTSFVSPDEHYRQNVLATYNLLEAVRREVDLDLFVFTSSSTVYGDVNCFPTPEDYAPLKPISVYGACKLACEALITSYAYNYGFKALIYRLANIVGPGSRHGVIYDFIKKLLRNPHELEILGDGTQTKSYLYIDDCIDAMLLGARTKENPVAIYNIGSEDWINVKDIANIVVEEMGLKNVRFRFTGGVDGGRGWKGDVKYMHLDVSKIKALGWKPKYNSAEAVRLAARALIQELTGR